MAVPCFTFTFIWCNRTQNCEIRHKQQNNVNAVNKMSCLSSCLYQMGLLFLLFVTPTNFSDNTKEVSHHWETLLIPEGSPRRRRQRRPECRRWPWLARLCTWLHRTPYSWRSDPSPFARTRRGSSYGARYKGWNRHDDPGMIEISICHTCTYSFLPSMHYDKFVSRGKLHHKSKITLFVTSVRHTYGRLMALCSEY